MMSLAWPLFRITEQAALAAWRKPDAAIRTELMGWLLLRCDRR
ncbi:fructose-1,6-bisphosphatase [Salmonella enterica subsp. arizonae]|nr:fructose-1,6-bisphosphatase [Salmonella enterica subsp. arizonae]